MSETPIWDEIADDYPGHPLGAEPDVDDWGLSPDCRVGKHAACSGDAWDEEADDVTECRCVCHAAAAASDEAEL